MCISCFGRIPRWGREERKEKRATAAATAGCGSREGARGGSENQCINYRRQSKNGGPAGRRTALCPWRLRVGGRNKGSFEGLRAVVIIRRRDSTPFLSVCSFRTKLPRSDDAGQVATDHYTEILFCNSPMNARLGVSNLLAFRSRPSLLCQPPLGDTVEPHCYPAPPLPE